MNNYKAWLKKLGYKEIDVNMGMMDFDMIVVIGKAESIEEYMQYKYECDDEFKVGRAYGYCYYSEGYAPIIWLPAYPRTPRQYGTLAHECFHAVMHLTRWANLKVNEDSEEVIAHAVSYIITSVLKSKVVYNRHMPKHTPAERRKKKKKPVKRSKKK